MKLVRQHPTRSTILVEFGEIGREVLGESRAYWNIVPEDQHFPCPCSDCTTARRRSAEALERYAR